MSQEWRGKAVRDLLGALYGVVEVLRAPYHSAAWERALQEVEKGLAQVRTSDPEGEASGAAGAPERRLIHKPRGEVADFLLLADRKAPGTVLPRLLRRYRHPPAESLTAAVERLAMAMGFVDWDCPEQEAQFSAGDAAPLGDGLQGNAGEQAGGSALRGELIGSTWLDLRDEIPLELWVQLSHWEAEGEDSPGFVPVGLRDSASEQEHQQNHGHTCAKFGGRCAFRPVEEP